MRAQWASRAAAIAVHHEGIARCGEIAFAGDEHGLDGMPVGIGLGDREFRQRRIRSRGPRTSS
jgi:hypothetical protein